MRFWEGERLIRLEPHQVFVFGSNPEGRHGLGAAEFAKNNFGAQYGVGRGLTGQSYALVTKNLTAGFIEPETGIHYEREGYRSVSLDMIEDNIKEFYLFASKHPQYEFVVNYTLDGRSLNGYSVDDFADCFTCATVPDNVVFHESFRDYLVTTKGFRGAFTFLSNFTILEKPFTSKYKGRNMTFVSSEHFYQAMKFEDVDLAERVAKHPSKGLKSFVNSMDIYIRDDWEYMKLDVMYYILKYKFSKKNPKLRQRLIDTGGIELVEYNWWDDSFFGVCNKTGEGMNHLGKLLMEVRKEIMNED